LCAARVALAIPGVKVAIHTDAVEGWLNKDVELFRPFAGYIEYRALDLAEVFTDTPFETWYSSGQYTEWNFEKVVSAPPNTPMALTAALQD
jgi:hypothetical protein